MPWWSTSQPRGSESIAKPQATFAALDSWRANGGTLRANRVQSDRLARIARSERDAEYPWLDAQDYVKRVYDAFGPRRIMWATDWPIVENTAGASYDKALTVVRDEMKFLNAEDKTWMMSKTIERVWPFAE